MTYLFPLGQIPSIYSRISRKQLTQFYLVFSFGLNPLSGYHRAIRRRKTGRKNVARHSRLWEERVGFFGWVRAQRAEEKWQYKAPNFADFSEFLSRIFSVYAPRFIRVPRPDFVFFTSIWTRSTQHKFEELSASRVRLCLNCRGLAYFSAILFLSLFLALMSHIFVSVVWFLTVPFRSIFKGIAAWDFLPVFSGQFLLVHAGLQLRSFWYSKNCLLLRNHYIHTFTCVFGVFMTFKLRYILNLEFVVQVRWNLHFIEVDFFDSTVPKTFLGVTLQC